MNIIHTHIFIRLHFNDPVYVMPSSQVSHEKEPQKTVASTFRREAFLGALGKLWEVPPAGHFLWVDLRRVGLQRLLPSSFALWWHVSRCPRGYWVHRSMWRATVPVNVESNERQNLLNVFNVSQTSHNWSSKVGTGQQLGLSIADFLQVYHMFWSNSKPSPIFPILWVV
jgi:hypothetical protein